jgi:hypothetical protein
MESKNARAVAFGDADSTAMPIQPKPHSVTCTELIPQLRSIFDHPILSNPHHPCYEVLKEQQTRFEALVSLERIEEH